VVKFVLRIYHWIEVWFNYKPGWNMAKIYMAALVRNQTQLLDPITKSLH